VNFKNNVAPELDENICKAEIQTYCIRLLEICELVSTIWIEFRSLPFRSANKRELTTQIYRQSEAKPRFSIPQIEPKILRSETDYRLQICRNPGPIILLLRILSKTIYSIYIYIYNKTLASFNFIPAINMVCKIG
jgi:hypothetical protein